ncbi:BRO family protein [Orrella sp. 11846]|uniref:BRO family protein n=1 Tax=Orrella sp. 11846 TaxID=3409913 RepID=UPI003B5C09FA
MKELMFRDRTFRLIEQDGKQWASAADIARALGYSRSDKVNQIFERHEAEFSASMTCITMVQDLDPQTGVPGQFRTARVFSLRGAHLIAMFSRTKKAQEFRRWVLDIIERHQAEPSLIQEWFDAKAALDAQDRFASLCGRGLNEHKYRKPPLRKRVAALAKQLQPSLFLH